MKIHVQMGREVTSLEVDEAYHSKVEDLMASIEEITGVFRRNQRLILKGKSLAAHQTLLDAKVVEGSKIMLIASSKQVPLAKESEQREKEREKMLMARRDQADSAKERRHRMQSRENGAHRDSMQERAQVWSKTGIVALREAKLTDLPGEIWSCAANCHHLDASQNFLTVLPAEMSSLGQLTRLTLSSNLLGDTSDSLLVLTQLTQLQVLMLQQNRLSDLGCLQGLSSLHTLNMTANKVVSVPSSISTLASLSSLSLSGNSIRSIPAELGMLHNLVSLDLSKNKLENLPSALSDLQKLQVICLDTNLLKSIPAEMLTGCEALHTIKVHDNPMTVEDLRQSEGFPAFDSRRKAKYSKQIGMSVLNGVTGFDEGADVIRRRL